MPRSIALDQLYWQMPAVENDRGVWHTAVHPQKMSEVAAQRGWSSLWMAAQKLHSPGKPPAGSCASVDLWHPICHNLFTIENVTMKWLGRDVWVYCMRRVMALWRISVNGIVSVGSGVLHMHKKRLPTQDASFISIFWEEQVLAVYLKNGGCCLIVMEHRLNIVRRTIKQNSYLRIKQT